MSGPGLAASAAKMREAGLGDDVVASFAGAYEQLAAGETGALPESALTPVGSLPDAASLPSLDPSSALAQTVVIKLNGGLGTSMGMTQAKSLLPVRDGLSFLDITMRQLSALRASTGARLPLVLMNSFATRDDSLAALGAVDSDVPPDFLQSRVPKLLADSLEPVSWPSDPSLEWAPPGHGDLYPALRSSGMLAALLDAGYRYAFVSNSDNLGAVLSPPVLAWFAAEEIPFLLEACDRTEADRKGGHLAVRTADGALVLREVAQTPSGDLEAFQDITRHRFFNTNNLWLDLAALASLMESRGGVLGLPLIVNRKTVDPRDAASPAVVQLESAMGAAIGVFAGARAVRVERRRFLPVKTTSDLLVLRSDAYAMDDPTVRGPRAGVGRGAAGVSV